jgi:1,4-dihydroxy-2-naphthoyl-CoA hydrolase
MDFRPGFGQLPAMAIWHSSELDLAQCTALGNNALPGLIGIEFVDYGDDWLKARMPVDARTHQPFGRLHGGASVVLAETVASVGGALTVDRQVSLVVGQEINANHIRPVKDGWVYAVAKAESIGRSSQVWTIRITDEQDRLVCLSRITLAVIPANRA